MSLIRINIGKDDLMRYIAEGKNATEISRIYGCSVTTVFKNLDRYGLRKRVRQQKRGHWERGRASCVSVSDEGAQNLATAIVELTIIDYRKAAKYKKKDDIKYFRYIVRSDWFTSLMSIVTDIHIDPEKIIEGVESGANIKRPKRTTFVIRNVKKE